MPMPPPVVYPLPAPDPVSGVGAMLLGGLLVVALLVMVWGLVVLALIRDAREARRERADARRGT